MIPVAFIAMIGVARRLQGRGFGSALLIDALRRVSRAADSLGIAAVLLDVLDCGDPAATERRRALYLGYGFEPLSANPARLFLPMATARCAITEA